MNKSYRKARLTAHLNELLNSGITLNDKEILIVEDYIQSRSKPVKPEHLNHYKTLSAIRSMND